MPLFSQGIFSLIEALGVQGLLAGKRLGAGQMGEDIAKVAGYAVVGMGSLDQAGEQGSGRAPQAYWQITSSCGRAQKGADGILGHIVVQCDDAMIPSFPADRNETGFSREREVA